MLVGKSTSPCQWPWLIADNKYSQNVWSPYDIFPLMGAHCGIEGAISPMLALYFMYNLARMFPCLQCFFLEGRSFIES